MFSQMIVAVFCFYVAAEVLGRPHQSDPKFNANVTVSYTGENTVILLDTNRRSNIRWNTKRVFPPGSNLLQSDNPLLEGWINSYYHKADVTTKLTCACDGTTKFEMENWLFSPYINVTNIPSIHILINFTMQQHNTRRGRPFGPCEESLNLFYASVPNDTTLPEYTQFNPISPNLTASKIYEGHGKDLVNDYMNSESRRLGGDSTPLKGIRGVRFAIQDKGACVQIFRVLIFRIQCPYVTVSLVFFPNTAVSDTCDIPVGGQCVHGAEKFNATLLLPTAFCHSSGKWTIRPGSDGSCRCSPGFRKINSSDGIESCEIDSTALRSISALHEAQQQYDTEIQKRDIYDKVTEIPDYITDDFDDGSGSGSGSGST